MRWDTPLLVACGTYGIMASKKVGASNMHHTGHAWGKEGVEADKRFPSNSPRTLLSTVVSDWLGNFRSGVLT